MQTRTLSNSQQRLYLYWFAGLLIVVVLASLSLVFRTGRLIWDKPLIEDGYYVFSVSRQAALGHGLTADGVHPCNGFHPLEAVLAIPAFVITHGDRFTSLRWILLFQCVLYVLSAWTFARIVVQILRPNAGERKAAPNDLLACYCFAALLYVANSSMFAMYFNGLETGLLLCLYCVNCLVFSRSDLSKPQHQLLIGILLGLLVLARIDAVFFVIILCVTLFFQRDLDLRRRIGRFLIMSGTSFAVSSPWWIYNYVVFGSLMPTSGMAEQHWAFELGRAKLMFSALSINLAPWFWLSRFEGPVVDLLRVALFALLCWSVWGHRQRKDSQVPPEAQMAPAAQRRQCELFVRCLLGATLLLAVWYFSSSWAAHFYSRYLAPLSLLSTGLAAVWGLRLLARGSKAPVFAALVAALPVLGAAAVFQLGRGYAGNTMYTQQLPLIERNVPPQERVAAGQSGTIGYFRDNVVNLDGKVNSAVIPYLKDIRGYLRKEQIRWVCDRYDYCEGFFGKNPSAYGWRLVDQEREFQLYQYDPSLATSQPAQDPARLSR